LGIRHSLRPLFSRGKRFLQNSGASRRENAEPHLKLRVWHGEGVLNARFFLLLWYFPLPQKRFMVPRGFAIGKIKIRKRSKV